MYDFSSFGRREIFTDVPEVTRDNVLAIVQEALPIHLLNSADMSQLIAYEAGDQEISREKKYRKDINVKCVDNIANEITEFKLDFQWAAPITFVQRDGADNKDNLTDAVTELNDCYYAEDIGAKTQELGRYVEICGIGYTYIDVNMEPDEGDSYFHVEVLDPRTTFVIKSNYYFDNRPMLAVTYRFDNNGRGYYTCFSKDERYELLDASVVLDGRTTYDLSHKNLMHWEGANAHRSGEENPLHRIPIIEWIRAYDRMGVWERQISEMDNLNLLISDFTNDVEQNTQAIWHANDVDFPVEKTVGADGKVTSKVKHPESSEWVNTTTTQDGREPFIKPLAIDYDYEGMLNNIMARRSLILQKCNVPQRNDNSGGSTGVAMADATGWSAAEQAAAKQQLIIEASKMEEVKVALIAAKLCPAFKTSTPMAKLNYRKIKPNVTRQRDYELTVKSNALATLLSHGVNGLVAMRTVNLFDDTAQAYASSKELIDKYQSSVFDPKPTESGSSQPKNKPVGGEGEEAANAERTMSDYSDQEVNSKMIGG